MALVPRAGVRVSGVAAVLQPLKHSPVQQPLSAAAALFCASLLLCPALPEQVEPIARLWQPASACKAMMQCYLLSPFAPCQAHARSTELLKVQHLPASPMQG